MNMKTTTNIYFSCEDGEHYIYALVTDMQDSKLEHVEFTEFINNISQEESPIWIFAKDYEEVLGILFGAEYCAARQLRTVGDILQLT